MYIPKERGGFSFKNRRPLCWANDPLRIPKDATKFEWKSIWQSSSVEGEPRPPALGAGAVRAYVLHNATPNRGFATRPVLRTAVPTFQPCSACRDSRFRRVGDNDPIANVSASLFL